MTLRKFNTEREKGRQERVLNLLDLVGVMKGTVLSGKFSTDLEAYARGETRVYPFQAMRWAIVGLQNAFHTAHIDHKGAGTMVTVESGEKYWILAIPKGQNFKSFASMKAFTGS